jgi:hypothetical protein
MVREVYKTEDLDEIASLMHLENVHKQPGCGQVKLMSKEVILTEKRLFFYKLTSMQNRPPRCDITLFLKPAPD